MLSIGVEDLRGSDGLMAVVILADKGKTILQYASVAV
jgi:hypothetical protein